MNTSPTGAGLTAPAAANHSPTGAGSPLRPEQAHHLLPAVGSLIRYAVRYLDLRGRTQHLTFTNTQWDATDSQRLAIWQGALRGIEQSGCKVLEVTRSTEVVLDLGPTTW